MLVLHFLQLFDIHRLFLHRTGRGGSLYRCTEALLVFFPDLSCGCTGFLPSPGPSTSQSRQTGSCSLLQTGVAPSCSLWDFKVGCLPVGGAGRLTSHSCQASPHQSHLHRDWPGHPSLLSAQPRYFCEGLIPIPIIRLKEIIIQEGEKVLWGSDELQIQC